MSAMFILTWPTGTKVFDHGVEGIPEAIAILNEDRKASAFSVLPGDGGDVATGVEDVSHGVG